MRRCLPIPTQPVGTVPADHSHTAVAAEAEHDRAALLAAWNAQRGQAHANARGVLDGPGQLGLKRAAVNRANEALARWAVTWHPIIPDIPAGHADIARFADRADDNLTVYAAVEDYAGRQAAARHPGHQHHAAQAAAPQPRRQPGFGRTP